MNATEQHTEVHAIMTLTVIKRHFLDANYFSLSIGITCPALPTVFPHHVEPKKSHSLFEKYQCNRLEISVKNLDKIGYLVVLLLFDFCPKFLLVLL